MARNINDNTELEIIKPVTFPIELISFNISETDTQNLYLTTCYKNIEFNGNPYVAGSGVVGFSAIEETRDIKTNSISIDLNGLPNSIIGRLEQVQGSAIGGEVTIYQAFWNESTGQIIQKTTAEGGGSDVYEKWRGIISSFSVTEENQASGTVKISVECRSSIGTLLDTKSGRFTSNASIQKEEDYVNDVSMEFVPHMIDYNPNFGSEE